MKDWYRLFGAVPMMLGLLAGSGNAYGYTNPLHAEYEITQQTSKVTGVVVDASGAPLIGVNVLQKGNSANGTITDFDGKFTLQVPANATLVFSYIGYKSTEVPVNGKNR